MTRRVSSVVLFVLLLSAGCDRLFGLTHIDPSDVPPPDGPPATTVLVQQQTAMNPTALTLSATLRDPPTKGNVLVMIGATDRYNIAPPTGGGVAKWMSAEFSVMQSNVEIWYGVTDGSDSTVTIQCGCTNAGNMRLLVSEWSGLLTTNLFEVGNDGAGSTRPGVAGPGSITTLDSPTLILFAISIYGSIASSPIDTAMWTTLDSVSVNSATQSAWYLLATAPGDFAPTVNVNGDWDSVVVAFRARP